nr:MAG TPA: hypothetical protein [Caudoviricetes sp.]DAM28194.1 MAG TPA: hypothetical protein [Caudoviricetes sp.]
MTGSASVCGSATRRSRSLSPDVREIDISLFCLDIAFLLKKGSGVHRSRRGLIKKFERQHGNSGFRDICRLKHGRIAEIAVFIAEFGTKAAGAAAEHRLGRDGQIADAFFGSGNGNRNVIAGGGAAKFFGSTGRNQPDGNGGLNFNIILGHFIFLYKSGLDFCGVNQVRQGLHCLFNIHQAAADIISLPFGVFRKSILSG